MNSVIVFQPALPIYRLDFFQRLADGLGAPFRVYYSPTELGVLTEHEIAAAWASPLGPIRQLFPGAEWQPGLLSMPLRKGDVVVISGSPRNLSSMLLLLKAKLRGAKSIWWGQYWSSTSRSYRFLLRMALMKLADAVLFYTDQEVEAYRSSHGRNDRRPIGALNNGIDVEPIVPLRAPYIAMDRDADILFIGRLTEKAELHVLVRALADPGLRHVRLHVVGDGAQKAALEALSRDIGVGDRIIWHGGMAKEPDIAHIANRCRLFVYPGGVGLSLIHAMAYGLPSIVHDDRWRHMPEIAAFQDGQTGRSFVFGSTSSLADRIAELVEDNRKLEEMSVECLNRVDNHFNTRVMSQRFIKMVSLLQYD